MLPLSGRPAPQHSASKLDALQTLRDDSSQPASILSDGIAEDHEEGNEAAIAFAFLCQDLCGLGVKDSTQV